MKIKILIALFLIISTLASCAPAVSEAPATEPSGTSELPDTPELSETDPSHDTSLPDVTEEPPFPDELVDSALSGYGASSILTLKHLASDRAVQQIAFYEKDGKTYVFISQRKGKKAYLTRAVVNKDDRTAVKMSTYDLNGYGHAESMDVSVHNGQVYLFITSKANEIDSYAWGTEITRFKIEGSKITDEKTLTGLECITPDGSPMFENAAPHRVNFGLDDDADTLAVYTRAALSGTDASKAQRITTYKLSDIHAALDAAETSVNIATLSSSVTATMETSKTSDICANGSFQGIEVDADGRILVSGGVTNKAPQISFFESKNGVITRTEVKNIDYIVSKALGSLNFKNSTEYVEIESIKYYKGNYYCVFNPANDLEQNSTEIYLLQTN